MTYDLPAEIIKAIYKTSDRANAPENQTEGFRAGFCAGKEHVGRGLDRIEHEWRFARKPEPEWSEWKRGLWAGILQKTWATVTPSSASVAGQRQPRRANHEPATIRCSRLDMPLKWRSRPNAAGVWWREKDGELEILTTFWDLRPGDSFSRLYYYRGLGTFPVKGLGGLWWGPTTNDSRPPRRSKRHIDQDQAQGGPKAK